MARANSFVGVNLGAYTLIIRNPREVMGHDDSLPYNAEFAIFYNDKEVAHGEIWNDGWGGDSQYRTDRHLPNANKWVDIINNYCKENVKYKFKHLEIKLGFTETIDILVSMRLGGRVANQILNERVLVAYLNAN